MALKGNEESRQLAPDRQVAGAPFGQSAESGGGQVVCPNCGAGFSVEEPRCPYCSTLNPAGAEKAYMSALADIRDDTDDLADEAQDSFEDNLQRNTKRTVAVIAIVVVVLVALFSLVNCMNRGEEQQALREYQARENFRTQHFAEFDRLYEAGDDDALSVYVWSLMDDPGFEALLSWEHVGLLEAHDDWEALRSIEDDAKAGTCGIDDYTWAVSVAFRLAQLDSNSGSFYGSLSREDERRAAGYRAYAWQFLRDTLQMSEGEIMAFADECKDGQGEVQEGALKENLQVRLRELGTLG